MIFIGIDPGKSGAMVVSFPDGHMDCIFFDERAYAKEIRTVADTMRQENEKAVCCLERVGAMPKQGLASTFNFGMNYGIIQGALIACGVPFELVSPQKWKKEFGVTSDKNTSIKVCQHLFPDLNLYRTDRCRKPHDGLAEAALMCEYARRKWSDAQR